MADSFSDLVFLLDIAVQFRTGYLEQGLMVYKTKKLAKHYVGSKPFYFDMFSLLPTDLFQLYYGTNPMFRYVVDFMYTLFIYTNFDKIHYLIPPIQSVICCSYICVYIVSALNRNCWSFLYFNAFDKYLLKFMHTW